MKDSLSTRMKSQYEVRSRTYLPRRTYTIIRVDGKAFHTYTKGCERPFDVNLIEAMNQTANFLCSEIQGAKMAYVQSDEISILLTDFDKTGTSAWFDGAVQKICSISASLATGYFNKIRQEQGVDKMAFFDSRCFTIPDRTEVENYFIWRQIDAVRNSILMSGYSLFSQKQLHQKSVAIIQDMLFEKGINWNDYPVRQKRGGLSIKEYYDKDGTQRSRWITIGAYWFTKEREKLSALIPHYPSNDSE